MAVIKQLSIKKLYLQTRTIVFRTRILRAARAIKRPESHYKYGIGVRSAACGGRIDLAV